MAVTVEPGIRFLHLFFFLCNAYLCCSHVKFVRMIGEQTSQNRTDSTYVVLSVHPFNHTVTDIKKKRYRDYRLRMPNVAMALFQIRAVQPSNLGPLIGSSRRASSCVSSGPPGKFRDSIPN